MRFPGMVMPRPVRSSWEEAVAKCIELGEECGAHQHLISPFQKQEQAPSAFYPKKKKRCD
jgi:hypothetical protein